jgi:hypothetical protein
MRTRKRDRRGGLAAGSLWYLQYSKIAPELQILLAIGAWKNSIQFILNILQGQRKAETVPPI